MAGISIALANIQNIKTVNIEGLGTLYVRRLGAGEELDLSSKLRRLGKLIDELSKIDLSKYDLAKPDDVKRVKKMSARVDEISDEIQGIKAFEFKTYKKCLSDDKNGEVVDVIMNTLTDQERSALFKQIFGEPTQVELDETVVLDREGEEVADDKK